MTDYGRELCQGIDDEFIIDDDIEARFAACPKAYQYFNSFPELYRRVRIDNIQRVRACPELFEARLKKLIEASERGEMFGDWNDYGRLLE